jgi:hypothetical protein
MFLEPDLPAPRGEQISDADFERGVDGFHNILHHMPPLMRMRTTAGKGGTLIMRVIGCCARILSVLPVVTNS